MPCRGGTPPLTEEEASRLLLALGGGWRRNAAGHLEREYTFDAFQPALAFANEVGAIAEAENHHPEITVGWGRCRLEIWTHAISGLTKSDFVLAAKAERASARRT